MIGQPMNRRGFVRLAAAGVAAMATPVIVRASALGADGRLGAGSRIAMAAVGVSRCGTVLMRQFRSDLRVQVGRFPDWEAVCHLCIPFGLQAHA